MTGLGWMIFGLLFLIGSLCAIDRDYLEFNSPFLWVFLFVGILMMGFGAMLWFVHA